MANQDADKERQEKLPKTPEELAEIAYLDKLRTCEGEAMPAVLPLACVVKVVAYEEVPKASEQYAMATVVKRNVYRNNCGVLYPLDDFHELLKAKVGDDCAAKLRIESAEVLRRKAAAPQPKQKAVFQPKPAKDDFLAKLRLHRKRYGW